METAVLFGCAVMTGVGAVVNTARVAAGTSVAVFGLGRVGLSVVMGARAAGADIFIGVDPLASKLGLAKQCGASHTVNSSVTDPIHAVREITRGGAVHESLAAHDAQRPELVKLRYFAGLSIEEAAEVLNISAPTTKRDWTCARTWLYRVISQAR